MCSFLLPSLRMVGMIEDELRAEPEFQRCVTRTWRMVKTYSLLRPIIGKRVAGRIAILLWTGRWMDPEALP